MEKIAKPAEIGISRSLDKIAKKTAEIGISRSLDKIAKKNSRNRYIKTLESASMVVDPRVPISIYILRQFEGVQWRALDISNPFLNRI